MLSVLSVVVLVAAYFYAIACMANSLRSIRCGEGNYEYILSQPILRLCGYRAVRVLALAISPLIYVVFGVCMLVWLVVTELIEFAKQAVDDMRNTVRKSK